MNSLTPNNPHSQLHLTDNRQRCPYCGQIEKLVWVHGHGQCAFCGTTVDECCRGEHDCDLADNSHR